MALYDKVGSTYATTRQADPRIADQICRSLEGMRSGFAAAYWRRPEAYLDPNVRAGLSLLALTPATGLVEGLERLRYDIDTGRWHSRYAHLLDQKSMDAGYRLVIADLPSDSLH